MVNLLLKALKQAKENRLIDSLRENNAAIQPECHRQDNANSKISAYEPPLIKIL